mgnify:CR=1 FL=1
MFFGGKREAIRSLRNNNLFVFLEVGINIEKVGTFQIHIISMVERRDGCVFK